MDNLVGSEAWDLPSIDLHTHVRGTFPAKLARELSRKNGVAIPTTAIGEDDRYSWTDFKGFLSVYESVGAVVAESRDLFSITLSYLRSCASEGSLYIELMLSPTHSIENGISFDDQVSAIGAGIECARKQSGIEAGLIVTCVRHRGPGEALRVAEMAACCSNSAVVGYGMVGDEHCFHPREFAPAFQLASQAGLKLTAHAGEWLGARSILETIDALNLDRVGHGVRAAEDKGVLAELAARRLGLEVCLSSNIHLGVVKTPGEHPLPALFEAGCRVSLATDDPAYFCTSPSKEYRVASLMDGIGRPELIRITENAVETAFCSTRVKGQLRERCSLVKKSGMRVHTPRSISGLGSSGS